MVHCSWGVGGGRILGFCFIPILLYTLWVSLGGSLALGTGHTSRFRKLAFFFFFFGFNHYVDRSLLGPFTRLRSLPIELGLIS